MRSPETGRQTPTCPSGSGLPSPVMLWPSPTTKRRPPGYVEPCIPTLVSKPPEGPQWIHEIKHDGYRLIVRKQADRARLFTRRGYDWTDRYPLIRQALTALGAASAVIDGEAVCCDDAGLAVFEKLHSRAHDDQVFLYAFDLLELDGEDWRPRPLEERKAKLAKLLAMRRPETNSASTSLATARPFSLTPASSGAKASFRSTASTRIDPAPARPGSKSKTRRRLA
jgi:ATP-dependent DNA ligase